VTEPETPRACYREANGIYFTRNAHRPDCNDPDCRGCRTCPEPNHCTAKRNCTWHTAEGELTCGRCIAAARTDLRWIATLAPLLLTAATSDGVDSEAANLAGPATDSEAWSWRRIANARTTGEPISDGTDEHHPLLTLSTWEFMLREDYGQPSDAPATVATCAAYLDRTLHRVAHDPEQDFPLLARELRKCRQHLEAVLHNDDRPERGVPCPDCVGKMQETKRRLEDEGVPEDEWPSLKAPRLIRKRGHWCDDEECQRLHYEDDSGDEWTCPRDGHHKWTHKAYTAWVEERRAGRRISA
jgi:hypothetical protein